MKCPMCNKELFVIDEGMWGQEFACSQTPLPDKDGFEHWIYHYKIQVCGDKNYEFFRTQQYELKAFPNRDFVLNIAVSGKGKFDKLNIPVFKFSTEEQLAKKLQIIMVFS